MNPAIRSIIGFTVVVFALVCCERDSDLHYPLSEQNNIDDAALHEAIMKAEADGGIYNLVVFRNGDIIAETYFHRGGADSLHPTRSVTKSVMSILFGIALDKQMIGSLDETVGDYLKEHLSPEDSVVSGLTIGQLLKMSGGFEWEELHGVEDFNNWARAEDHLAYALKVPIVDEPGANFTYTSTGCQILSAIFTSATGLTLKAFAEEHLYPELGITGDRPWGDDIHGYNYGGVTLRLKARDMVRIGEMFLNRGTSGNMQVVSSQWVDLSTTSLISSAGEIPFSDGYGYLWWTGENSRGSYYFANGYGGQFIAVFPGLNLVVTAQSEIGNEYRTSNEQWYNTISLIMNDVLNAVQ
jgi:CubicO group peptidase (beta-lactamase class C family)